MRAIVIVLALLVGGCSEVSTPNPLLSESDGVAGAPVRGGVWRLIEPGCKVPETDGVMFWPACSRWGFVTGRQVSVFDTGAPSSWQPMTVVSGNGDPTIVQIRTRLRRGYLALKATRVDASGQVVEASVWPILCGPRQEPAARPLNWRLGGAGVRASLFAGLEADGDLACSTDAMEPLRAAAKASEPLLEPLRIKWVRDELK